MVFLHDPYITIENLAQKAQINTAAVKKQLRQHD